LSLASNSRIDGFVRKAAEQHQSRLTPSFISKSISVGVDEVRARLLTLSKDGQVLTGFEIECPNSSCSRSIATFYRPEELKIGEQLRCWNCETEFILSEKDIWVTFTPNPEYFGTTSPQEKKTT
jgi:hypothetical protein